MALPNPLNLINPYSSSNVANQAIGGLLAQPKQTGSVPQSTLDTINKATGFNPYTNIIAPSSTGQPTAPGAGTPNSYAAAQANAQSETQRILKELAAMQRQTIAPAIDFNTINSQARAQAESAVNPYYTKQLNDFLTQQNVVNQRRQTDFETANQTIQDALDTALKANETTGQRTSQDVATNLNTSGNQQNYYQQQEGTNFDQARSALQGNIAQSGLLGSGLGAQKENQAIQQRNQQSAQVQQQFQAQKESQNLMKSRTFEDLANSSAQATKSAGKATQANQVDLNRYLEDNAVGAGSTLADQVAGSGYNVKNYAANTELARQSALISQQQALGKIGFQNYLKALNPAQQQAAAQAYGGLF